MNKFEFFKEALQNFKTVGTVTVTSNAAIRKMMAPIDFLEADCIVELGAGNGNITKMLLEEMKPTAKLLSFEINEKFCEALREIDDDRLVVIEDSAENIGEHLEDNGFMKASHIVSALPLIALPKEISDNVLDEIDERLELGGYYTQIQYGVKSRKIFEKRFNEVKMKFVLRNTPPCFVYICKD